jgi:hypothetical protein
MMFYAHIMALEYKQSCCCTYSDTDCQFKAPFSALAHFDLQKLENTRYGGNPLSAHARNLAEGDFKLRTSARSEAPARLLDGL